MGEARRRMEMGLMPQGIPGQPQQIQVDLKNATPKLCECGAERRIAEELLGIVGIRD